MLSTHYSRQILTKHELSQPITSQIKLKHKISSKYSSGNPADSFGRTDRHDETNSRFSKFCERA